MANFRINYYIDPDHKIVLDKFMDWINSNQEDILDYYGIKYLPDIVIRNLASNGGGIFCINNLTLEFSWHQHPTLYKFPIKYDHQAMLIEPTEPMVFIGIDIMFLWRLKSFEWFREINHPLTLSVSDSTDFDNRFKLLILTFLHETAHFADWSKCKLKYNSMAETLFD